MDFKPATEDEIAANGPWPSGSYAFVILEAEEKLSASKGNPMIELRLELSRRDGKKRIVRDYLLPQRQQKLLNAAKACGVLDTYNAGQLIPDDFIGKSGQLRLAIQRSRGYPPKNVVEDYLTTRNGLSPKSSPFMRIGADLKGPFSSSLMANKESHPEPNPPFLCRGAPSAADTR